MLKGSCHCGAVSFELSQLPQSLMDCNCSVCRRIGALWGHVAIDAVTVNAPENGLVEYIHGDRMLAFNTCNTCGCTTHWSNLLDDGQHMAVNCRMCDPKDIEQFRIRRFDGAETWQYLDDE